MCDIGLCALARAGLLKRLIARACPNLTDKGTC